MRILIALMFIVIGCASPIPFQKMNNGIGYEIEPKGPETFAVKMSLPDSARANQYLDLYAAAAIGEECKKRGYEYFDHALVSSSLSEGFCYKENRKRALAISFARKNLELQPAEFVVEDLNSKSKTALKLNDKITKFDGKVVQSMGEIKSMVFSIDKKNVSSIKLELIRDGKVITVDEPLADFPGSLSDPKSLVAYRKLFD